MNYKLEYAWTGPTNHPNRRLVPKSITIHHWDDPARNPKFDGTVAWMLRPTRKASVHYVAEAGRVCQMLSTDLQGWHCGNSVGNSNSLAIECNPRMTAGDLETVAHLIADLRRKYGYLPLFPHKYWYNTACPGYWEAKLAWLDQRAEEIRGKKPTPEPSFPKGVYEVHGIKADDPDGGLVRREGPGTNYPVYGKNHLQNRMKWHATGKIQNGWSEGQSDWQKDNNVGTKWVHTNWLKPYSTPEPKPTVYEVTAAVLNARGGPGTNHKIVGTAPKGTRITATGKTSGKWLEGQTPWQLANKVKAWYHIDHLKLVSGAAPKPPKPTTPKPPMTVLSRGSRGKAVGILQRGLNKTFPAYSKLTVDSIFGPATDKVVKEFQRRSNLTPDGVVGEKTQRELLKYGIKW